jgi:hypothetical protein
VALAAVANDGNFLALDQVHVGIAVVENAHRIRPLVRYEMEVRLVLSLRRSSAGVSRRPGRETLARYEARLLWINPRVP